MASPEETVHTADVAIVGFGPVAQSLAALIGRAGHSVVAVERHHDIYRLPRAVHLDHEIMRLLQSLGVTEELAGDLFPVGDYHWFGADGEPLMTIVSPAPAPSGWESDYMFFQPTLEEALVRRALAEPTVTVLRGWEAEELVQDADDVTLTIRPAGGGDAAQVRARWLIGADGANSFVREAAGITRRDLGFRERWLVVDVEPHDMDAVDLPPACQWCDPRRPTTHIRSGARHRRWEFMLLPGEETPPFETEERAWALLAPWFAPQDGTLLRHTVYEFRSMLAERMRSGRVLLVGDAAHLTPPFLGQGLCSGLRDAANLAWKLDLVLRGRAGEALLDTVFPERDAQNDWVINVAVGLGQVLCQTDAAAAAERDAMLRAAGTPPPLIPPPVAAGVVAPEGDPLAGTLSVQGRVAGPDGETLLDDVTGPGFTLLVAEGDPRTALAPAHAGTLERLGVRIVALDGAAAGAVRDHDGRMSAWLGEHGVHAALVRPDFCVFGSAATPDDVGALIGALGELIPDPASAGAR